MKILHVIRQYAPAIGGAERFVAELSQRLMAHGHQVEVITLNRRWRDGLRLSDHEFIEHIPVHRLPYLGTRLFFIAPQVLSFVRHFDVVHVHHTDFFLDFLVATRWLHHKPMVVSTHGGFFHTSDHAALKQLYFVLFTQHSLRAVEAVLPNSLSDEKRFAPYARRAQRIDNAIDHHFFARGRGPRVRGRLITVGRLVANKKVQAVLEVFAAARAQRSDLSLHIIGDGELRAELEAYSAKLKIDHAIQWLGEVSDEQLRDELGAAEIFLSAAIHEAFGLALLEAMAAGCVPVVNDIEAFRDVIVERYNGFLTPYANTAEAAATLVRAAEAALDSLSPNAKNKAAQFDWEQAVLQFEKIYAEVGS